MSHLNLRRALLALALAGLLGAVGLLARPLASLTIRVSDLDLLPAGSPVLAADQAIRQRFGSEERLILAFEAVELRIDDPRFREDLLFFEQRLAESSNVELLLFDRLFRPRFRPTGEDGEPYLLGRPGSVWIDRALAATAVTGQLAAGRTRRAVFLEAPAFSAGGVATLEQRAHDAAAALEARRPGQYRVRLLGRHVVLNALGETVFEDLQRLLPFTFLLIALLFWALFRSPVVVALALVQSGVTVVLTLALQARLGHPLSLMTALVPVLVTVIGIADEIHFFDTFLALREARPGEAPGALAWETLKRMFFPCTAITLTTVIGFAAFWATEAPALQVFGLIAGIGLAVSWLISLTLVPAVLALVPARGRRPWAGRAGSWGEGHQRWLARALLALSLLALPGLLRLRVDDGWTRNFRADHPVVEDVRWFEGESVGLYQLDLMLAHRPGRLWTEPAELARLERLQRELGAVSGVTASLSLADLLRDRAWELGDPARDRPPLPEHREEIDLLLETYLLFNEEALLRMFLDREQSSTRMILGLAGDDYVTASHVRREVDAALRRAFAASPGNTDQDGEVAALVGGSAERGRVLIESIVRNQITSVTLALGLSLLLLGFASGRWGQALRCIGASAWALLLVLGAAGWLGLELGVATSSFLALGVGVGLDYGIHLAFHRGPAADHGAVLRRVAANVLVVGAGLSVLMLSGNPTIARLGFLTVASLVASAATAATVFSAATRTAEERVSLSAAPKPA